ncbi:MAG TPA: hypothetical protein VHB02_02070 [Acidimicrobiales bacterium]|nr:hypothetical protein [Acidimicrobiales bacterium]
MKRQSLTVGAAVFVAVAMGAPVAAEAGATTATGLPKSPAQVRQALAQAGFAIDNGTGGSTPAHRSSPELVTPSQWSNLPTPTFGSGQTQVLESVSCGSATSCVAVGEIDSGGVTRPIAAVLTEGSWKVTTVPVPTTQPDSALVSVSCPSASFCVAVGDQASTPSTLTPTTPITIGPTNAVPLIEQWNGSAWTIVPSPTTGETDLTSVSCASSTFCVAVGTSFTASATTVTTVVDRWDGTTWSASRVPSAATTVRLALGVSCTSATFCMLVGVQFGVTGVTGTTLTLGTFSLRWDGTSWTTVATPKQGPTILRVTLAVSCANPSVCTAVGAQLVATATPTTPTTTVVTESGVIEQWDGSAWTTTTTPRPTKDRPAMLRAVDCFGPTSCVAAGLQVSTSAPPVQSLVENWNGAAWTVADLPTVATTTATGTGGQALYGVSCAPGVQCVAVGENYPKALSFVSPVARSGYDEVASDGGIFAFGPPFYGSMGGKPLNRPVVGMAMTPDGGGYWEVASDGGLFAFGDAVFYGSMGGKPLNQPIVGMAATPDGRGYWEVASDGGIFAFGDARFLGSMGGQPLNKPVVGLAVAPSGGYYEVASDGGLFAFGAPFLGSMGGQPLNKPVVGMAVAPSGDYYEVASDGGIFAFGAPFLGSMGGQPLNKPVVGMAVNDGGGYYEVASDGGIFAFGAPFLGSMGGQPLNQPIVGMAQ